MRWERMLRERARVMLVAGVIWAGVVASTLAKPSPAPPHAEPPPAGWACTNHWVMLDTETTGFYPPIYVIEIAAQRMVGWVPEGPAFRVFLDHEVLIPAGATRVHGYDATYLKAHGVPPVEAYEALRAYVDGAPLVCHNLAFDWNRALVPEWQRLGIAPVGEPGFCTLLLARRVLTDVPGYGLEALKEHYGYDVGVSHHADGDVVTSVRLLQEQIGPRLEAASITELGAIRKFSRRSPIADCRAQIAAASSIEEGTNHE